MDPKDEEPKPGERDRLTKAGRWKIPGINPDQPELPTAPLDKPASPSPAAPISAGQSDIVRQPQPPPAAPEPSEFTRMFQSPPVPPGAPPPRGMPQAPAGLKPAPPVPPSAPPPPVTPRAPAVMSPPKPPATSQPPGEFTRMFQAPPV